MYNCFIFYTGHEVLRLPVAHCELNPIEMAWAQIKEYVRWNNQKFTLAQVERLIQEGFSCVTPELWTMLISHVERKVKDHYWEWDGLFYTKRHNSLFIWETAQTIHPPVLSIQVLKQTDMYLRLTGSYRSHIYHPNKTLYILCTDQLTLACIRATNGKQLPQITV